MAHADKWSDPGRDAVELMRTKRPGQADVIVAFLRGAEIPAFVFTSDTLSPLAPFAPDQPGIRIMVRRRDRETAAALVADAFADG